MKFRANIYKIVDDKVALLVHADDLLYIEKLRQYKEKDLLSVEVKKWKPIRTLTQNKFFHLLCQYLASELKMDMALVKEGIKERYGVRVKVFDKLVPKPSHLCNKFEEMSQLIEGVFIEAGEQGIDMTDWIKQWMEIKERRDEN